MKGILGKNGTESNAATPPQQIAAAGSQVQGVRGAEGGASAGLLALLNIEAEARNVSTPGELHFLIAGETRKLTRSRQVFVFLLGHQERLVLEVISGLPAVDRSSPLVLTFESLMERLKQDQDLSKPKEFEFGAYCGPGNDSAASYPFTSLLWLPFLTRAGSVMGGMLLTREQPWTEADVVVGTRLSQTFAHALRELASVPRWSLRKLLGRKLLVGLSIAAGIALCLPITMTILAPFEVGPLGGFVVAAPIEGIIEEIAVDPNSTVVENQLLVRFNSTLLKNRFEVAEREVLVADARLKKSTQVAFEDEQGRHDLGVLISELQLKTAERDFAKDMLERSQVRAARSGIAVFADKKQFIGRPVSTGERIMEIADPRQVEALVDVPVGDAIVLKSGARVKLFLDSDPLRPREAVISLADYLARVRPGNQISFRVVATLEGEGVPPRLGARGTAQIYGESVPLAFFLFRRPLTALRQWTGL
jgi:hypothetical protein